MSGPMDAKELSGRLAKRLEAVLERLGVHGRIESGEFRPAAHPLRPDGNPDSFRIRMRGEKRGLWSDFARAEHGDPLDLAARAMFGGDLKQAFAWGRRFLGLDGQPAARRDPAAAERARREAARARRAAEERAATDARGRELAAAGIWSRAVPVAEVDPVWRYLRGRGIDLVLLPKTPYALRCHPALRRQGAGCAYPAMVAAFIDPAGRVRAIHRSWLMPAGTGPGVGFVKLRGGPAAAA